MNKSELLKSVEEDASQLLYKDGNLNKVRKRAEMIAKKVFGNNSDYIESLKAIRFRPAMAWSGMDKSYYKESFENGKKELINLINVMEEDISLSNLGMEVIEGEENKVVNNKIFVVHGHNEEMKQAAARFIEKIDLNPIILHEQPNKGRTIIEKFTDYSNVSFALVLLSADDVAFKKSDDSSNAQFRARQNVILELGFFLGKLGREKVLVLFEPVKKLEIPSDYQGVIFVPYDTEGKWTLSFAKELKQLGFQIDGNKLLE